MTYWLILLVDLRALANLGNVLVRRGKLPERGADLDSTPQVGFSSPLLGDEIVNAAAFYFP
jgi:hypothetical protein